MTAVVCFFVWGFCFCLFGVFVSYFVLLVLWVVGLLVGFLFVFACLFMGFCLFFSFLFKSVKEELGIPPPV